jgi:hypothetical protein
LSLSAVSRSLNSRPAMRGIRMVGM